MANKPDTTIEITNAMTVDELVNLVYNAESNQRYDDMCKLVKRLIVLKYQNVQKLIECEDRYLLSVAYKNIIETKKKALNDHDTNDEEKKLLRIEIADKCSEILNFVETYILKDITNTGNIYDNIYSQRNYEEREIEVFFLTMCGDYSRRLTEIKSLKSDCKDDKSLSKKYYEKAYKLAESELTAYHPTYLNVASKYSLFLYEILDEKAEAIQVAMTAFTLALECIDRTECNYKDHTLIMQVMIDNVRLWKAEMEQNKAIKIVNFYIGNISRNVLLLPHHVRIPHLINNLCIDYYYMYQLESYPSLIEPFKHLMET